MSGDLVLRSLRIAGNGLLRLHDRIRRGHMMPGQRLTPLTALRERAALQSMVMARRIARIYCRIERTRPPPPP